MSDRPDDSPTAVDVVLRPEWAAFTGTQKTLLALATGISYGYAADVSYVVPVGKTLYIVQYSASSYAAAAADGDKAQPLSVVIRDETTPTDHVYHGGDGGLGLSLSTPIVIPANHRIHGIIENVSNHNTNVFLTLSGFEV